ncbi:uncharacterized protein [Periplaneta americana]|uniref:uncharacterized protein n=1 Tax=Periplaneta americana TaxID=6978 RepID=UPI0037E7BAA7
MRDDQTFNMQFVGVVERYPVIYDYTRADYSKKNVVDKVWAEIAAEVKEKLRENCSGDDCKNRWRVIRSSYVRSKNKKLKCGERVSDQKEYYLAQCMQFLLPFTKSRMRSGNIPRVNDAEPSEDTDIMAGEDEDEGSDPKAETYKKSDELPRSSSQRKTVETKRKHQGTQMDEFERRTLEYYEMKKSKSAESPDLHFFRGLLPYIEEFTSQERLKFQKSVLDAISNIYDQRTQPVSQGSKVI